MKFGVAIILILACSSWVWAEDYMRSVSLEWDAIEGAASYDLEFTPKGEDKNKAINVTVKYPAWTGKLAFGKYTMRMRAKDRRKVPGDWSSPDEFQVNLENVKPVYPAAKAKIASKEEETHAVVFEWKPVGGAKRYKIEVTSADGKTKIVEDTKSTDIKIKLPVAQEYTWKIEAELGDIRSDAVTVEQFQIQGKKLEKPDVPAPLSKFVREIEWARTDFSDSYDYSIQKLNPATKKWEKVVAKNGIKENKVPFDLKWKGGQYRISVRANSNLRPSSDVAQMTFPVANGDRSPAAEEVATLRESIERTSGWFLTASYLVTALTYQGTNYDATVMRGAQLPDLFGGTGRLGLGYLSPEQPWGFHGIVDYSGFIIADKVYNFGTLEANAIYRTEAGRRGEIRQHLGLYYKELPVLTNLTLGGGFAVEQATALGPHYGAEYWYAMTRRLGFQLNAHLYYSLVTMKTPNGGKIIPNLTYQYGILGSYRLSNRATGLMGIAIREDSLSYESNSKSANNEASISGSYINFLLEWAL